MMPGTVSILSVGSGDAKLVFDKSTPAEMIRAGKIVKDMLRRGYALLIEWEQDGHKYYKRATDFDETVSEYIIADFDPVLDRDDPEEDDHEQRSAAAEKGEKDGAPKLKAETRKRRVGSPIRVPADSSTAVAVGRTAGG